MPASGSRRPISPGPPRCARCAYDTTDLETARCPECGQVSDPAWRSGRPAAGSVLRRRLPLFAAASSHYASAAARSPRLVMLDEAFAGIDDDSRAKCMGLLAQFDLDFVMTSEREWGCYPDLPGLAIAQLVRREDLDAVFVSHWTWDGRRRHREPEPPAGEPAPGSGPAEGLFG